MERQTSVNYSVGDFHEVFDESESNFEKVDFELFNFIF